MADNETIHRLTVDTSGSNTEDLRKKLESLKKEILLNEESVKKYRAELKAGTTTIDQAAGPISQHEAKLKGLRTEYLATQQASQGLATFTQKIGSEFSKAVSPLSGFLAQLGPMGNSINSLVGKVGQFGNALGSLGGNSEKLQGGIGKIKGSVDGLNGPLSNLGKHAGETSAGIARLNASSDQTAAGIGKLNAFTSGLGKAAGGALLGIGALVGGLSALGVGITSSVKAYDESEKAARQLTTALGGSTVAAKELLDQAHDLQDLTGISDEAIVKGQSFAASLGISTDSIKELTPLVLDLAAATGQDVTSAFEAVASTLSGGRDALKKYGISLSDTASQGERTQQVIEGLTAKFQGQAAAIGSAGGSELKKFQVNLDDLSESIGSIIVRGIGPFVEGITSLVHGFNDLIEPAGNLTTELTAQRNAIVETAAEGTKLVDRYDELSTATNLTDEEHKELNKTVARLTELFPSAITKWDEYGKAVGISSVAVREHLSLMGQELRALNADRIQELTKALENLDQKSEGINLPDLGIVFSNSGQSLKSAEAFLANLESVRKTGALVNKELGATSVQVQSIDAAGKTVTETFAQFEGKVVKLGKGQNNVRDLVTVQEKDLTANEDKVRSFFGRLKGYQTTIQAEINKINGEDLAKSIDELAKKQKEEADAANAAAKAYTSQAATLEELTNRKNALNESLKSVPENDTGRIKGITDEIKAIDKRIEAFKVDSKETKKNTDEAAKAYAEREQKIRASLALELAAIDDQESKKLVSEIEGNKRRGEALSKFLSERIQQEQEAATKASKGGEIPLEFRLKISGLESEKAKVDREVTNLKAEIENRIKEVTGKIVLRIEADTNELEKQIADAIAMDDLSRSFEESFTRSSKTIGVDLRTELTTAALDGTIDFDTLIANKDLPKKTIEELRAAYLKFQAETKTNAIEFTKASDEQSLARLKDRFAELVKLRAELVAKKETAETDVSIVFTDEDAESLSAMDSELDALDGKIVTASVKVNADTAGIDAIAEGLKKAVPDGGKKDSNDSPLAKLFGLDQETTAFLVDSAVQLGQDISDAIFTAQRERIQRSLDLTIASIDDTRNSEIQGIEDQIEAGLITEQEGAAKRTAIDKAAAADRKAAAKKAFEEERAVKRASALVNLGAELAGIAATSVQTGLGAPFYLAIQTGLALARFAGNIATINGAQFAEEGAIVQAERGRIAKGPSHAEGGIPGIVNGNQAVELEGEEAIINKRSTKKFAPLLSAINQYEGNGISFAPSNPVVLRDLVQEVLPEGKPMFASGGKTTRGIAMVNASAPALDPRVRPIQRADFGAWVGHAALGSLPVARFAMGGQIPKVFAGGGEVSVIPADGTIANRRQLEASATIESNRVIALNGEGDEKKTVVYISELSAKTSRIQRTMDRVSFGG
jgi:hypothetical protein